MTIYECQNCECIFEGNEPKCPRCHSEDVIEYEVEEDE